MFGAASVPRYVIVLSGDPDPFDRLTYDAQV
jgi:hypothetical protein